MFKTFTRTNNVVVDPITFAGAIMIHAIQKAQQEHIRVSLSHREFDGGLQKINGFTSMLYFGHEFKVDSRSFHDILEVSVLREFGRQLHPGRKEKKAMSQRDMTPMSRLWKLYRKAKREYQLRQIVSTEIGVSQTELILRKKEIEANKNGEGI